MKRFLLFSLSLILLFGGTIEGSSSLEAGRSKNQETVFYQNVKKLSQDYTLNRMMIGYLIVLESDSTIEQIERGRIFIDDGRTDMRDGGFSWEQIETVRLEALDTVSGWYKLLGANRTKKQQTILAQNIKKLRHDYYVNQMMIGYILIIDESSSVEKIKKGQRAIKTARTTMLKEGRDPKEIESMDTKAVTEVLGWYGLDVNA